MTTAGSRPTAGATPFGLTARRIRVAERRHPGVPLHNMAKTVHMAGPLDPARFVESVDAVVRAADGLRTVVDDADGVAVAVVQPEPPRTTEIHPLPLEDLDAWVTSRLAVPLDATSCPYDSVLLDHGDDRWTWFLDLHHVIADAGASAVVVRAVDAAYRGEPIEVGSLRDHLRALADGDDERRSERRHRWELAAAVPHRRLEVFGPPGPTTTRVDRFALRGAVSAAELDTARGDAFAAVSEELSTLTLLVTAASAALHRMTGAPVVRVGIPVHHRRGRTETVVGTLMETVPVDVRIGPEDRSPTVRGLARTVGKSIRKALAASDPETSPDVAVDVLVNVVTARYGQVAGLPTTVRWPRPDHADPGQPIQLAATAYDGELELEAAVNHAVGGADRRSRLAAALRDALAEVVRRPDATLDELDLSTAEDATAAALLVDAAHPPAPDVVEQLLAGLRRDPDRIAVFDEGEEVTCAALEDQAGRVAAWLLDQGLGRGARIALRVRRRAEVFALVHGTLRAGASFLFVDPDAPAERTAALLEDAAPDLVLDAIPDRSPRCSPRRGAPTPTRATRRTSCSPRAPRGDRRAFRSRGEGCRTTSRSASTPTPTPPTRPRRRCTVASRSTGR